MNAKETVSLVCQNCPTEVLFENHAGPLRVTCPQCKAVVYMRPPSEEQREYVAIPGARIVRGAHDLGPTVPLPPKPPQRTTPGDALTHDGNVAARPVVLTADETERVRKLLDW